MAIRFEIVVNGKDPIIIGYQEEKYAMSAIVNAGVFPGGRQDISITASGLQPETGSSTMWINETLKPGDEIRIKVVEDIPISEPLQ